MKYYLIIFILLNSIILQTKKKIIKENLVGSINFQPNSLLKRNTVYKNRTRNAKRLQRSSYKNKRNIDNLNKNNYLYKKKIENKKKEINNLNKLIIQAEKKLADILKWV